MIITHREKVFETAVHELKQLQSVSSSQYAIKLFGIYYKMSSNVFLKFALFYVFLKLLLMDLICKMIILYKIANKNV